MADPVLEGLSCGNLLNQTNLGYAAGFNYGLAYYKFLIFPLAIVVWLAIVLFIVIPKIDKKYRKQALVVRDTSLTVAGILSMWLVILYWLNPYA